MDGAAPISRRVIIRLIKEADSGSFGLLLGAGCSVSSGVPSAADMIRGWRAQKFNETTHLGSAPTFEAWCATQKGWFEQEDEYSTLFEMLYPTQAARQKYLEQRIEPVTDVRSVYPGWGYLYLANMIVRERFNVIFTTNFDDLINEALSAYVGYNPVVCAADSEVDNVALLSKRAKIIKLHGDYLFRQLKNTRIELMELDPNMAKKFRQFAQLGGLVVVGYAGRDQSVMRVLGTVLKDDHHAFGAGVYWGVREGAPVAPAVADLAKQFPGRFMLFTCSDFDEFMARLHGALGLELPQSILRPIEATHERLKRLLVPPTPDAPAASLIEEHRVQLVNYLRPWLGAQSHLARRDPGMALRSLDERELGQGADPDVLTCRGEALAARAANEGSDSDLSSAVGSWRDAKELNPDGALSARTKLARYFLRIGRTEEASNELESLVQALPKDKLLGLELVTAYWKSERNADALAQLCRLLEQFPVDPHLHCMRAQILSEGGPVSEALAAALRAVALDPNEPAFHRQLGLVLASLGHWKEASSSLDEAVRLDPQNASFRIRAAQHYLKGRQPRPALAHLEEAVRIAPDSTTARELLAVVHQEIEALDKAGA